MQTLASLESAVIGTGNSFKGQRIIDGGQMSTVLESPAIDRCYCVGEMNSAQICAALEGADIDCFQAVIQCFIACNIRETEIGQAHTPFKSILAD